MSSTIFKRAEGKGLVFGDKKNRGSWLQIPILLYTLFTTVLKSRFRGIPSGGRFVIQW